MDYFVDHFLNRFLDPFFLPLWEEWEVVAMVNATG